jgi:multisubunit Na+/H+ antiporter MnhG subunit
VFGVIAIPLGWIQVIGYAFALLFGALAIVLGAIGLIRAGRLPAESGRYIAVLAVLLGIAVVIWKVIEGVGPAVVVTGA